MDQKTQNAKCCPAADQGGEPEKHRMTREEAKALIRSTRDALAEAGFSVAVAAGRPEAEGVDCLADGIFKGDMTTSERGIFTGFAVREVSANFMRVTVAECDPGAVPPPRGLGDDIVGRLEKLLDLLRRNP